MPLTPEDRIALEHSIKLAKDSIPQLATYYRDPEVSSNLLIKNVEDYVLGQMTGYVMGTMTYHYLKTKNRKPLKAEFDEFNAFLHIRINELRHATMLS